MSQVGIRELKAKLSEYVERSASGEVITVTDRGRPVAQLTPLSVPSNVERGILEGWIEAPRTTGFRDFTPRRSRTSSATVLDEDRE